MAERTAKFNLDFDAEGTQQLEQFGRVIQQSAHWIAEAKDEGERFARVMTLFGSAANQAGFKGLPSTLRYVSQNLADVAREGRTVEQMFEDLQRHASLRGHFDIAKNLGGLRQWVDELPRLQQELEKPPSRWKQAWIGAASAVQVAVGNVMAEMVQAGIQAAKAFMQSSIAIRIARENAEATFTTILGGTQQMERAMQRLQQASSAPGLTFDVLANKVVQLMQAGQSFDAAVLTAQEFGNALAFVGRGADDTADSLQQFVQMLSTGKVTMEDFRPLMERSPQFAKALDIAFGTRNIEKIREMGLTMDEFARRFIQALQQTERAPDLTSNAITKLRGAWDQAKAEFGRGLLGDKAGKEVGSLADVIADLVPKFKAAGEAANGFFRLVLNGLDRVASRMQLGSDVRLIEQQWEQQIRAELKLVPAPAGADREDWIQAELRRRYIKAGLLKPQYTGNGELLGYEWDREKVGTTAGSFRTVKSWGERVRGWLTGAGRPPGPGDFGPVGDQPSAEDLKAQADKAAKERQRREIDALRKQRAELELARKRAQAEGRGSGLPSSYSEGMTIGGLPIHRVMPPGDAPGVPPHYGTHREPGTFDIRGSDLPRDRSQWPAIAQRLADMGLIVADRRKGDQGITNDHFHIVDPRLSPGEAERLRGQAARGNKRIYSGRPGAAGGTPNLDAQIAAIDSRIAELQGGEAVAEYRLQALEEMLRRREADRAIYIDKLQAMLDYAEITGELPAGADQMGLQAVSDVQAALAEAQALQIQEFGTAADWYRLMVEWARDAVEAERDLIEAREEALSAEQAWAEAQLRAAQESRRSLAEQLAFLDQINALTLEQIDLQQQADELDPDKRDTAGLRADSARMQQEVAFEQQRHDLIERDRDLREQDLQQAASLAQARLNLAEMTGGESAAAAQYEEALRRQLQFYGQMGDQIEYVRVKLELLRLERDRHKATIGEQILMAGPGAGSITAYLNRIGVNPIDLGGPTIDANALRPGTLRGDVPLDGLAGDAASRAIASRGNSFVDQVATAAGLATEQILDEVIAGFGRAG